MNKWSVVSHSWLLALSACVTIPKVATPTATVTFFTAGAASVTSGSNTTLAWSSQGAGGCHIDALGDVAAAGTMATAALTTDTTFTITCGAATATTAVKVTSNGSSAGGGGGSTSPVRITNFAALAPTIASGASTTLSWSVANATSCVLSTGTTAVTVPTGTQVVTPTATTAYTLTCQGDNGPATTSVVVTVTPLPAVAITSFTADSTSLSEAAPSTSLHWVVAHATSCSFNDGMTSNPVSATGGAQIVSPTVSTGYILTCQGPFGPAIAALSITVSASSSQVQILTFNTDHVALSPTQSSATLSWTTSHAASCTLNGAAVGTNTSSTVSPTATTAYTLSCGGTGGPVTAAQVITYTPATAVALSNFVATPNAILAGDSTVLTWSVTNATNCDLANDAGGATVTGVSSSTSVSPTATTTYTLSCTGAGAGATASVKVTVSPLPVRISNFVATPNTITAGGSTSLTWTVANATVCALDDNAGTATVHGVVSPLTVSPPLTTTYTLSCTGAGASAGATTVVTVNAKPADAISFFTANSVAGTTHLSNGQSVTLAWGASASICTLATAAAPATNLITATPSTSGSLVQTPTVASTLYNLTCGTATASVTVVIDPLAITTFTSDLPSVATALARGSIVQLSWISTGAVQCHLLPLAGAVALNGSIGLSPQATTPYTLNCLDAAGTAVNAALTINVQAVVYANANATGAADGLTWGTGFANVQDAVNAAASGEQVWVAAGTYAPTTTGAVLAMKDGVSTYGGFSGGERYFAARPYPLGVTVLDASNVTGDASANVRVAVGAKATLDGFVLTKGGGPGAPYGTTQYGGGLFVPAGANLQAVALDIDTNHAGYGAGVAVFGKLTARALWIKNNTALDGGGMGVFSGGSVTVTDSLFDSNTGNGFGGGFYAQHGSTGAVLGNDDFRSNFAAVVGGAIAADNSSNASCSSGLGLGTTAVSINGANFFNNTTNGAGSAVSGDGVTLVNGVVFNTSQPAVDPFDGRPGPDCVETPTVTYTAASGPLFDATDVLVDNNGPAILAGTSYLYQTALSPGLNAGTPTGANASWTVRNTVLTANADTAPIDMGTHHAAIDTFAASAVAGGLTFAWTLSPQPPSLVSSTSCSISPALGVATPVTNAATSVTANVSSSASYTLTCDASSGTVAAEQRLSVSPPY